mmetsp:Transcript_39865/g.129075  ORF Transcript_39865/g.129075 Transcript_39865/m.129075 type:complete len:320 (+) Transcript_39865:1802-2761(+)
MGGGARGGREVDSGRARDQPRRERGLVGPRQKRHHHRRQAGGGGGGACARAAVVHGGGAARKGVRMRDRRHPQRVGPIPDRLRHRCADSEEPHAAAPPLRRQRLEQRARPRRLCVHVHRTEGERQRGRAGGEEGGQLGRRRPARRRLALPQEADVREGEARQQRRLGGGGGGGGGGGSVGGGGGGRAGEGHVAGARVGEQRDLALHVHHGTHEVVVGQGRLTRHAGAETVRLLHRQPADHVARVRRRVILLQRSLARCAVRLASASSYAGRLLLLLLLLLLGVDSAVRGETDVCNRRSERAEKGEAEHARANHEQVGAV